MVILLTVNSLQKVFFFIFYHFLSSMHCLSIAVAGDPSSGYVPGSPGAPWTDEEVKIVQEKVR